MDLFKEKLNNYLKDFDCHILFVKNIYEFGQNIIEITVDGNDLTSDKLSMLSNNIVEIFDKDIPDNFCVSLTTKGIDTKIKDTEDLKLYKGSYINFVSPQYKGKGLLKDFDDEYFYFEVNIKAVKKQLKIKPNNLSKLILSN